MAEVLFSPSIYEESAVATRIADCIVDAVQEEKGYLVRGTESAYEIRFETSHNWFELDVLSDNIDVKFKLVLHSHTSIVWREEFDVSREQLRVKFGRRLHELYESGFPSVAYAGIIYRWEAGVRDAEPIQQYYDEIAMEGEDDNFGMDDGEDLPGGSRYEEDDETPEDVEQVATPKQLAVQPSIVPDDFGKVRIVALKYKGEVIAFRFKTEVGAFDMRKSVAASYGVGGFKTETFISLESVNGLLMSKSERKKQVCVPDVSDCPEDCCKLMRAVFGD